MRILYIDYVDMGNGVDEQWNTRKRALNYYENRHGTKNVRAYKTKISFTETTSRRRRRAPSYYGHTVHTYARAVVDDGGGNL